MARVPEVAEDAPGRADEDRAEIAVLKRAYARISENIAATTKAGATLKPVTAGSLRSPVSNPKKSGIRSRMRPRLEMRS